MQIGPSLICTFNSNGQDLLLKELMFYFYLNCSYGGILSPLRWFSLTPFIGSILKPTALGPS